MTMTRKTLLDLKDGLRAVSREAGDKLNAHGVRDTDEPVFDRARRYRHKSLRQEMLDEIRSWNDD